MQLRLLIILLLVFNGSLIGKHTFIKKKQYTKIFLVTCIIFVVCTLKCHICDNLQNSVCRDIRDANDNRFLRECPTEMTQCAIEIKIGMI